MSKKRRQSNDYSRRRLSGAGVVAPRRPLGVTLSTAGLVALWLGTILGAIVVGAWVLGFVTPMESDRGAGAVLGGVVGLFSGLVAAAGVTGGLLMVGWWGLVPGLGVGVSMFGAVAASRTDGPWVAVAVLGFVAAIVGFYIAGLRSGFVPPAVVKTFGSPLAVVGGLVALWIGIAQGNLQTVMVGIGFILVPLVIGGYGVFERSREHRERDIGSGRRD